MKVRFKNTFFRDLQKLPPRVREKVENIVFYQIPIVDNLDKLNSIKKIHPDKNTFEFELVNSE